MLPFLCIHGRRDTNIQLPSQGDCGNVEEKSKESSAAINLNVLGSMLIFSFLVRARPLGSFAVCSEKWKCCCAAESGVGCEAVC